MIGNATMGSYALGALNYCYYEKESESDEVRGEILFAQNLTLSKNANGHYDMKYLAQQFDEIARMNRRVKQHIWHQSFSFPIDEKPSVEQIQIITQAFSKEFGFEENQLVAFRHADTAHEHFHIVANRVNLHGKNSVSRYDNFHRIGRFCRMMEKKLGLKNTLGMISDSKQLRRQIIANSSNAAYIKAQIDKILSDASSLSEFKKLLKEAGIETDINRGINFQYQKERFKGSDFGREYSLMNLEKRLALNNIRQERPIVPSITFEAPMPKQESKPLLILDNTLTAAPNSPKRKLDGNEDDDAEERKRKRRRKLKL